MFSIQPIKYVKYDNTTYPLPIYIYILIRYWMALWFFSFAIETTFPLSNFKTKHIFRIFMERVKYLKPFGAPHVPQILFSSPPKVAVLPNAAPMAPLPRRATEIQPKAGVSRVYIYLYIHYKYLWCDGKSEILQITIASNMSLWCRG